jgi:hypothetical protein
MADGYANFNKRQYSSFKAQLTKALRAKDWRKILGIVVAVQAVFDAPGAAPRPDDWNRWIVAEQDALMMKRREDITGGPTASW